MTPAGANLPTDASYSTSVIAYEPGPITFEAFYVDEPEQITNASNEVTVNWNIPYVTAALSATPNPATVTEQNPVTINFTLYVTGQPPYVPKAPVNLNIFVGDEGTIIAMDRVEIDVFTTKYTASYTFFASQTWFCVASYNDNDVVVVESNEVALVINPG